MTNDGMLAKNYSAWIDLDITLDPTTKLLVENYVIGSPAFGLSQKGRDLYTYYHFQNQKEYLQLWEDMCKDLPDCYCADNYGDLKNKLTDHEWLSFNQMPTDVTEAIYIYVGTHTDDKLFKEHFSALTVKSNGKNNNMRQQAANDCKRIAYVDKLLSHIRNSFAHGQYSILENESDAYYILQDVSKNGCISARMVLTATRLKSWIDLFEQKRQNYITTQNIQEAV